MSQPRSVAVFAASASHTASAITVARRRRSGQADCPNLRKTKCSVFCSGPSANQVLKARMPAASERVWGLILHFYCGRSKDLEISVEASKNSGPWRRQDPLLMQRIVVTRADAAVFWQRAVRNQHKLQLVGSKSG